MEIIDKGNYYELYVDKLISASGEELDDKALLSAVFNQLDDRLKELTELITSNGQKLSPIFRNRLMQLKSCEFRIEASAPFGEWGAFGGGDSNTVVTLSTPELGDKLDNNSGDYWDRREYIEYALSHELGHIVHSLCAGVKGVVSAEKEATILAVKLLSNTDGSPKKSICNDKLFDLKTFGPVWESASDVLNILGAVVGFYAKKGSSVVKPIIVYDSNCENAWRSHHGKPLRLTHNSTCITEGGVKREQYGCSCFFQNKNELANDLYEKDNSLSNLSKEDEAEIFKELKERYEQK